MDVSLISINFGRRKNDPVKDRKALAIHMEKWEMVERRHVIMALLLLMR